MHTHPTRRDVLKLGVSAAAALVAPGFESRPRAWKDIPIGTQLWCVRQQLANEIAEKIKPQTMRVGYHNHTTDFNRIGGEYWWNLFADRTSKDVMLQFDTGNASEMPGVRVVDLIRRNAGRTISMHVKPFSSKN